MSDAGGGCENIRQPLQRDAQEATADQWFDEQRQVIADRDAGPGQAAVVEAPSGDEQQPMLNQHAD